MIALFLLFFFIVVGMNTVNYVSFLSESDDVLELLSKNKGSFPDWGDGRPPHMSPEIPFETRFFTAVINSDDGNVVMTDTSKVAAVDADTAAEYALRAADGGERGFIGAYRYCKTEDGLGTRIVFLDCGRKLDTIYGFALASALVSLLGYVIVFFAVVIVSGMIVRPVSESYERQKRFIADAGHEIKTPLTIINANADLYSMENGDNEYVSEIKEQARHLTGLCEKLIMLTKLDGGSGAAEKIEFLVSDTVLDVVGAFSAPLKLDGKTIKPYVEPMLSMQGDEGAVRQLVTLLIDNAMKYSIPEDVIEVSLSKEGRMIVLSVVNSTDCPLPDDMSKLFLRFFRPDTARNSKRGGHGIGLSVAEAIAKSHGGMVRARRIDGKRVEFVAEMSIK